AASSVAPYRGERIARRSIHGRRRRWLLLRLLVLVRLRKRTGGANGAGTRPCRRPSGGARLQARRRGANLVLELRHPAVRLLLPLARRGGDDAAPAGLAAALARPVLVARVGLAADLETAAGLAGARLFGLFGGGGGGGALAMLLLLLLSWWLL